MAKYSLPYRRCLVARRCTAPSHFSHPNSRFCIDFYLPQGTPILAARPGVVVETESRYNEACYQESFRSKCNFVLIRHANGEESNYAHLAYCSIKVKVGQKVKRGQMIGLSGQTGYATYPHLHFAVYNAEGNNIRPTFDTELPAKTSYKRYSLDKEFLICK